MGALYDLVGFSTTTTGTGTITAGSALTGLRPLSTAPDGTVISYSIKSASGDYETGTGTVGSSGVTLTRTLRASTTGSLLNLSGTSEVRCSANAGDFPPSGGAYEVEDWPDLAELTGVPDGRSYRVLNPLCVGGVGGTNWKKDGSLWRPDGKQLAFHSTALVDGVSGGSTSETNLAALQFPPGMFAGVREFVLRGRVAFSASDPSGNRVLRWRMGTSSTAGDGALLCVINTPFSARLTLLTGTYAQRTSTALAYYSQGSTSVANQTSADISFTNTSAYVGDHTVANMATESLWLMLSVVHPANPTSTTTRDICGIWIE
jgi:hypothetical protein